MASDSVLVVLCETPEQLISACERTAPHGMPRFFVSLGAEPSSRHLRALGADDRHMATYDAKSWFEDAPRLGMRLGVLYSIAENLFFCWADDYPSAARFDPVYRQVRMKGEACGDERLWGGTRHGVAMGGFSSLRPFDSGGEEGLLSTAFAGGGPPSEVAELIADQVPMFSVHVHHSMRASDRPKAVCDILEQVLGKATSFSADEPKTIFISGVADPEMIYEARERVGPQGRVVVMWHESERAEAPDDDGGLVASWRSSCETHVAALRGSVAE